MKQKVTWARASRSEAVGVRAALGDGGLVGFLVGVEDGAGSGAGLELREAEALGEGEEDCVAATRMEEPRRPAKASTARAARTRHPDAAGLGPLRRSRTMDRASSTGGPR